jgi:hypothetical protein
VYVYKIVLCGACAVLRGARHKCVRVHKHLRERSARAYVYKMVPSGAEGVKVKACWGREGRRVYVKTAKTGVRGARGPRIESCGGGACMCGEA